MKENIYPIGIIGGGAAGTMAVLRTVLNNDETLFFPGSGKDKKRSRALWVKKVENMPGHLGYKRGIEDPNLESLKWLDGGDFREKFHWKKGRGITGIAKLPGGGFELTDSKGEKYKVRFVIMCTGVTDVQPHISNSIEPIFPYANVQIVDYCIRCDGHHVLGKRTSIIGHTNGAAWVSIILKERYDCPEMTILTNGKEPEFGEDATKILKAYGVKVRTEAIVAVSGNDKEAVLKGYELEDGSFFETDFTFVSLGMIIYNDLSLSLGAKIDERGFVLTDEKGQTNVEGLYVAGDLRANVKKQIYTAWDTAVDSADHINGLLRAEKRARILEEASLKT